MPNISVIIAAAGSGSRMGGSVKKQYRLIEDLPVLAKTAKAFCAFREIIVTSPKGDEEYIQSLLPNAIVVTGGDTRQASVLNALEKVTGEYVLIHDGARPFVSQDVISRVVEALKTNDAVIPGVTPKNTIRTKDETLNRDTLFEVQTPQGFKTDILKKAHKKALEDKFAVTDDASVTEHYGIKTCIVEGDYKNIKITTEDDMPSEIRSGHGYDVHKLVPGRKLMLGCVEIPYEKGLLGHSDADVCIHAIADAMLGAAALRDIGYHFPDTSKETEGMSGEELLTRTYKLIKDKGYTVVNIDATIVAQAPKLSPFIEKMREQIAKVLEVNVDRINVKATTEEGLGITGNMDAICSYAVANLKG